MINIQQVIAEENIFTGDSIGADYCHDAVSYTHLLDLSHMLPGPVSTMLMADMGAEVINIEPPSGDSFRARKPFIHEESTAFLMVNLSLIHI